MVHQLTNTVITAFNITWSYVPSDVLGMQSLRKSIKARVSRLPKGDWHAQQKRQSAKTFRSSVTNPVSCFLCLPSPIALHWSSLSSSNWMLMSWSFCRIFATKPERNRYISVYWNYQPHNGILSNCLRETFFYWKLHIFYKKQTLSLQPGCFLMFCQIQPQMFLKCFINFLKFLLETTAQMRQLWEEKGF